ncbi:MAG: hypothetical protein SGBAC_011978 [Bacillariaceae sp.]
MVKCWDLETNQVIRHYHGHLSGVFCLALHPTLDVLVTGGRDAVARVWDMRTKTQIHVLSGHEHTVASILTKPTDPQIITGSHDSTVKLWDLAAGKVMTTLTHHQKSIRALAQPSFENTFVSGAADCLKYWQAKDGRFIKSYTGHKAVVNAMAVNDDGVLVSGGDDGSMHFWDYKTGHNFQASESIVQPGSLDAENAILTAAFDGTGTRLITGEADKSIKIWKQDEEASDLSHPIDMVAWRKKCIKESKQRILRPSTAPTKLFTIWCSARTSSNVKVIIIVISSTSIARAHRFSMQIEELLIKNGRPITKLEPRNALTKFSMGERIKGGRTFLRLSNLVSAEECQLLAASSVAAARDWKLQKYGAAANNEMIHLEQGSEAKVFVRLLTQATADREETPEDALPKEVSELVDQLLKRALSYLDTEACPSLKKTLFGEGIIDNTDEGNSISMAQLFRDQHLEYSIREPAINVYEAPHGHFAMHKDHHALSILIPLSDPATDFGGGGTAFWSQSHPMEGMDSPSIILKPKPGTALLWGGRVSHKGMTISSGTRVVMVASFSGPNSPREDVKERLSAGLGVRTILSAR